MCLCLALFGHLYAKCTWLNVFTHTHLHAQHLNIKCLNAIRKLLMTGSEIRVDRCKHSCEIAFNINIKKKNFRFRIGQNQNNESHLFSFHLVSSWWSSPPPFSSSLFYSLLLTIFDWKFRIVAAPHVLFIILFIPNWNISFRFHALQQWVIRYPTHLFPQTFHKSYASIGIYTYVWLWAFVSKKKNMKKTFLPSTLIVYKLWLSTCQPQQQQNRHSFLHFFHYSLMIALFAYR